MDEAELEAHAKTWLPSDPPSEDRDAQLRYLLVMRTSGSSACGVQAVRDVARRYNPRSQARSLAQLQEIMQFDFGHDPSGVTDRLVVFERLIGEYETSSGEQLGVQVKCAVLLERVPSELRTHLLLTCGSRPDYAIMRQTVESYDDHGNQANQRQREQLQWKSMLSTKAKERKERATEQSQV